MLGVLRMLATAETVMKHIVSQVMVLADGMALAFAGVATAFAVASVLAMAPPFVVHPSPAPAGTLLHYSVREAGPLRALELVRRLSSAPSAVEEIKLWIPSVAVPAMSRTARFTPSTASAPAAPCHTPRPAATPM